MTDEIRAPRCPGCDRLPEIVLQRQYWCSNDQCRVLTWNPFDDPATFKAKAQVVDLGNFLTEEDE